MEASFLGGAGEVGRSAVLVDDSLLLDYGVLASDPPQYPVQTPEPDAVVASHGHLDHVGAVPALLKGDADRTSTGRHRPASSPSSSRTTR